MRFLIERSTNEKIKVLVVVWVIVIDYKFIFLMSKQLQQNNQLSLLVKSNKQENSDNKVNHENC